MLTSKQIVDDNSRYDGLSGAWNARIEQRRIFRPILPLKLRILQKLLSGASLMPVDKVLMLYVIVDMADPFYQVEPMPCSGIVP
jgi:hypothetical protein